MALGTPYPSVDAFVDAAPITSATGLELKEYSILPTFKTLPVGFT